MNIGYDVRYGIAPTAAASWLISHRERKFNTAFNSNFWLKGKLAIPHET